MQSGKMWHECNAAGRHEDQMKEQDDAQRTFEDKVLGRRRVTMMEMEGRLHDGYYWGEVEEYAVWETLFWSFDVSCCI